MSPLPFSTNSAFTDFLEEDNNSTDDEDASDRDYIDRMVKEAEAAKEGDSQRKKIIDLKNEADQYIYNTDKQLQEHSAKIRQGIKDQIRGDISALNEAIVSEDADKISAALEKLKNSSMEIGKSIYSQQNSEQSTEQSSEHSQGDKTEENKQEEKK